MTHFPKLRLLPILRWVSFNLSKNPLRSPKHPIICNRILPFCSLQNRCRFCTMRALEVDENDSSGSSNNEGPSTSNRKIISAFTKREAQSALLDYLHSTRSLQFMDAEHMSKNTPHFVRKLVQHVAHEADVRRSLGRFLRYHPINEFEPFLESIGLAPCEFGSLLPRDLMFLSDEEGLLDNFHVLCEYGLARDRIGKIFREAREVFRYDHGVLQSRLLGFEELGLSQAVVAEAVSSSPYLLLGDVGTEFAKVVSKLKCLGYDYKWIGRCLVVNTCYNWRQIFELLCMLSEFGCNNKEIGKLIGQHPEILFDGSGRRTFTLIGFALKFGLTKDEIASVFTQFPSVKVGKFVCNLRRASQLLTEIEMDTVSIGKTIRPHLTLLGTISVKKANSVLSGLNTGKRRLCDILIANPLELKNWTLRAKLERLPEASHCHDKKISFLLGLGFAEKSKQMEKALKLFRGRGDELQERFDCLVQAGLSQSDVAAMIKTAPQILNQSKELIESKIDLLVNELGYPLLDVKAFPSYLAYTIERVKLRHRMYKWLCDKKVVRPSLSLSTFIACTESHFMKRYVKKHPMGPEVWQELKSTKSSV